MSGDSSLTGFLNECMHIYKRLTHCTNKWTSRKRLTCYPNECISIFKRLTGFWNECISRDQGLLTFYSNECVSRYKRLTFYSNECMYRKMKLTCYSNDQIAQVNRTASTTVERAKAATTREIMEVNCIFESLRGLKVEI